MIGMIAAISPEWVIGLHGQIPWDYPADQRRFMQRTLGSTVIMGRHTWEALPKKPLPRRRNIVVTRQRLEGVECMPTLQAALEASSGDVWICGGTRLYEEGLEVADVIDLTYVPDRISDPAAVKFPRFDETVWQSMGREPLAGDPRLEVEIFERRRFAG